MKKKRLDEIGVMESENGPMTFAKAFLKKYQSSHLENDFTAKILFAACTLSYKANSGLHKLWYVLIS